ncbi:hypothetical protein QQS21_005459 [Conoideocrella luteorostrata]|uniref:RTA1 like protein n=1 Tax=Conoideocrella luteorostrata TaxID=1105319 RepID=A0AAJ0FTU5_9HYPO|nr:hypothetical protein QQS21_005459 [Conoideocrella luteorostrata]
MKLDKEVSFAYYQYDPSLGAAILFVILFVLITAQASYVIIRGRTWFLIPFVLGGFFEWIGYIGRAASAAAPYTVQALLLLLGQALLSASSYMLLGRIISLTDGAKYSIIPIRWLTTTFVAGDTISFVVQGVGGGMMASGNLDEIQHGQIIVIIGLAVQLLFFSLFFVDGVMFHMHMNKRPSLNAGETKVPWRRYLYTLYAVSTLIMIRAIYRIIEYAEGNAGYLVSHEVFLYILDALLMLAVMVLFAIVNPGKIDQYHPNDDGEKVTKDEAK